MKSKARCHDKRTSRDRPQMQCAVTRSSLSRTWCEAIILNSSGASTSQRKLNQNSGLCETAVRMFNEPQVPYNNWRSRLQQRKPDSGRGNDKQPWSVDTRRRSHQKKKPYAVRRTAVGRRVTELCLSMPRRENNSGAEHLDRWTCANTNTIYTVRSHPPRMSSRKSDTLHTMNSVDNTCASTSRMALQATLQQLVVRRKIAQMGCWCGP